jgi:hypothetical protein
MTTEPDRRDTVSLLSPECTTTDECPGLAVVPLSHRWTPISAPLPGTSRRSDSVSMIRRVPERLKDFWSLTVGELPQALRVSNAAVPATASADVRRSFTLMLLWAG